MNIQLSSPSIELLPSWLLMLDEMKNCGEEIYDWAPGPGQTSEEYIQRYSREETSPAAGFVPHSTFWAVAGSDVVGSISFRHFLNENLKKYGGHIGYEVRPSYRRRGVATQMLGLLLQKPQVRAVGKVLLTCAPTNIGSNKTILANGGVLESTEWVERIQRMTNLYWITLS